MNFNLHGNNVELVSFRKDVYRTNNAMAVLATVKYLDDGYTETLPISVNLNEIEHRIQSHELPEGQFFADIGDVKAPIIGALLGNGLLQYREDKPVYVASGFNRYPIVELTEKGKKLIQRSYDELMDELMEKTGRS